MINNLAKFVSPFVSKYMCIYIRTSSRDKIKHTLPKDYCCSSSEKYVRMYIKLVEQFSTFLL